MNVNTIAKLLLFWYFFIFVSTEALSYFYQLNHVNILVLEAVFWSGIIYYFRDEIKTKVSNINFSSKTNLVILTILFLTFIQGFFSAPSTTDSMVYHLPKVMYWVQEGTVYQDVIRNIHDFKAPFAEYIVLHLYFLVGSDRLAFLSQWLAFVASVYLAGIIARQFGGSREVVNFARLFTAALPIAVMQSASTQVDLVVTVLVLIALHISLLLTKQMNLFNGVLLGITIGLGFFTKATYFIYLVVPFGLLFFQFIKNPERKYFYTAIIVLVLTLLIQARFFYQNYSLYGSLLGKHILWDGVELKYTNEQITFEGISSNVIRNLFVHIPVPVFSGQVQLGITALHNFFAVDLNDEKYTCCGTKFLVSSIIYPQEDIVANTVHLILIFAALFYLIKTRDFERKLFWGLSAFSFILFSAVLKWQPYHTRLEIPIFITGSIASILILGEKRDRLLKTLASLSIILAFLVIIFNVSRPFVTYSLFYDYVKSFSKQYSVIPEAFYIRPRVEQYFNAEYFWYEPYDELTKSIASPSEKTSVSFVLMDDFEYPLWVLVKNRGLNFTVIPRTKMSQAKYIIKSSERIEELDGYEMVLCKKTAVDYGYICLYNRKD